MVWQEQGYEVLLTGRTYPNPEPLDRPYRTERFHCRFHRGPLFYLEFQWRLWKLLRMERPDVYLANDLDTLWPHAFWAKRRGSPWSMIAMNTFWAHQNWSPARWYKASGGGWRSVFSHKSLRELPSTTPLRRPIMQNMGNP